MSARPRIAIAGAGLGGLTAALALLRRGFDVAVYEQAAELREVGAGVQIAANGSRVLNALGLAQAVGAVCCETSGKEIRLWNTGQTWKLFDLGEVSEQRYGAPYYTVHRGDLQAVLAAAVRDARPDAIRLGAKVLGFEQDDRGVTLRLEGGAEATADVLVGADGVHSVIRRALFGPDTLRFTGTVAWRGLVPAERLSAHLRRPVGVNWVGPGSHVVHYLLRRGELLNFVGVVERTDWQVESWNTRGTPEECRGDFAGWNADVQEIVRNVEVPYKWALIVRDPLPRWSRGRVTLLGDACHPMLPFLAQGANMAIEDGMVLARGLARYGESLAEGLRAYEATRLERTARTMRGSADNLTRFHNRALATPEGAQAYIDSEWSEERVKQRYDWLFEYDALTIPV